MENGDKFFIDGNLSATGWGDKRVNLKGKEIELTHSVDTMSSYYLVKLEKGRISRLIEKSKFNLECHNGNISRV